MGDRQEMVPDRESASEPEALPASFEVDVARLIDLIARSGEEIEAGARENLMGLVGAIFRWNKTVNLVSRKDIARLVSYHFCDAASLLPLLRPRRDLRVLDLGGSNGLPGLVLATLSAHIKLTICDSRRKRREFLEEVCGARAAFEIDRVDSEAFRAKHSEGFDLIVARAVTRFRLLLKWCLPLLKPGGRLVAYKGSRSIEEVNRAKGYLFDHGGSMVAVVASPWAVECNPLRLFVIAKRGDVE